jgi:hypothetical protein
VTTRSTRSRRKLRPLGDPRIHAAIVCASAPARRSRASRTPRRSRRRARCRLRALRCRSRKGFAIQRQPAKVQLSSIFKWFAEDFDKQGGALSMIGRYLSVEDRAWLEQNVRSAGREYMSYDWSVNG